VKTELHGTPAPLPASAEKWKRGRKICQQVADPGHGVRREGWRSGKTELHGTPAPLPTSAEKWK